MPNSVSVPGVLFTDMDATLLDHHDYSFAPAIPVIERLKKSGVPIVLCTSKTLAELLEWQERLSITGPMIVENGGGVVLTGMDHLLVHFPEKLKGYPAITLGSPYSEIVEALARFATELPGEIRGFGNMSTEEIVAATGLKFEEAGLAAMRDFDEPFTWEPEPDAEDSSRFEMMAHREGYMLTKGGRFYHLTGPSDKGRAVRWVMKNLFSGEAKAPPTIGLGDSDNDLGMLLAVDRGILVEKPGGGHLVSRPAGVECAEGVGPQGWAAAVTRWLDEIL